jgi:hypothetical protein
MLDFQVEEFDEAVDYIISMIGSDFEKSVALAGLITENPQDYTGPQALRSAVRLSAYRYKIGLAAQFWKIKSAETKLKKDRLVKDALMLAYDALGEVINTLKLAARHDHDMVSSR